MRCALSTIAACAIVSAGCVGGDAATTTDGRQVHVVDRRVIHVGDGAYDVQSAFGSIWISDAMGLVRLSPRGGVLARTSIPGDGEWSGVASNAAAVYAMQSAGTVARVDPRTDAVTQVAHLGTHWPIDQIAATNDAVCAILDAPAEVDRLRCLDPASLTPSFSADVAPGPMTSDTAGTIWIGGDGLVAVHPAERSIDVIVRPRRGIGVPAATSYGGGVLAIISRRTSSDLLELGRNTVLRRWTLPLREVVGIATNRGAVWIRSSAPHGSGTIDAMTPTGDLRPLAHIGAHALGFAASVNTLWVVNYAVGTATVLTLSSR